MAEDLVRFGGVKAELLARAGAAGFSALGVVALDKETAPRHEEVAAAQGEALAVAAKRWRAFLLARRHGDMGWMARGARAHPHALWAEARSAVMLGFNYAPARDPRERLGARANANISVYALGRDYHLVLKAKLKKLGAWLADATHQPVKHFVDTAPILEKPMAAAAGLGWQGKHTNLVSRQHGSWLFLASLWSAAPLPPDAPHGDHCGNCRACLDACPTNAFPAPYQLDARRCISYLTIEHKGPIPRELRAALGNRIYGCDDCLAACPWNKYARAGREQQLAARDDLRAPPLVELSALDDAAFRARFAGSPIKRTGRARFVRNVVLAMGNAGAPMLRAAIEARLADAEPLVRGAAVWALGQYAPPQEMRALARAANEPDSDVRAEWEAFA